MEFSIIFAKILGTYLIISGFFLLFRGKTVPLLLKDFFAHRSVVFLSGAVLIFLGGALVFRNTAGEGSELVWVTAVGWLVLIKGALYILAPEFLAKFNFKKMHGLVGALGILAVAIGVSIFLAV